MHDWPAPSASDPHAIEFRNGSRLPHACAWDNGETYYATLTEAMQAVLDENERRRLSPLRSHLRYGSSRLL